MLERIRGQERAVTVLSKLLRQKSQRTLLFLGPRACGKMTAALEVAKFLFKKDPFLNPNISIYRNDDYGLKTRFFLKSFREGNNIDGSLEYFSLLLNRLSQAVYLDEFSRDILSKYQVQAFRSEFEENILNRNFGEWIEKKGIVSRLENLSDLLSKKRHIPIRQIRHLIDFHQHHSDSPYRMSVLGDFDQATEEAQNSALKLFEEPSDDTMIILTASSTEKLLPTILSRTLVIKFQALRPSVIRELSASDEKTLMEWMQDTVYGYRQKRKEFLFRFFTEIAPKVQYESRLFDFMSELTESTELLKFFLKDLSEFFRDLLILRNQYLRKTDLSDFLSFSDLEITRKIVKKTPTSDIRRWVIRLEEELEGIRRVNLTPKTFLPSLLIDLARWYQSKAN